MGTFTFINISDMQEKNLLGEKVITEEGKVALREHRYKGDDPS